MNATLQLWVRWSAPPPFLFLSFAESVSQGTNLENLHQPCFDGLAFVYHRLTTNLQASNELTIIVVLLQQGCNNCQDERISRRCWFQPGLFNQPTVFSSHNKPAPASPNQLKNQPANTPMNICNSSRSLHETHSSSLQLLASFYSLV